MSNNNIFINPKVDFLDPTDSSQQLIIKHSQEITTDFLDHCKSIKAAQSGKPAGETHIAACIPVAVYEAWKREGFDPVKEGAAKVLARLRNEHLDAFITTDKRLG